MPVVNVDMVPAVAFRSENTPAMMLFGAAAAGRFCPYTEVEFELDPSWIKPLVYSRG